MPVQNIISSIKSRTSSICKNAKSYKKSLQNVSAEKTTVKKTRKEKFALLKNYIISKRIKLTKAQVQKLSKIEDQGEFILESSKIINKSGNIPDHLVSPIAAQPLGTEKIAFLYDPASNMTYMNTDCKLKNKSKLFAYIAHEREHQLQNYKILRTEFLGEKAIEEYSKLNAQKGIDNLVEMYKGQNVDIEPFKEQLGPAYDLIKSFKFAETHGDEALNKWIENAVKSDYETILSQYKNIRNQVIEHFGVIKSGTPEAKLAQEYYSGFMNHADITKPESILNIHEAEAWGVTFLNHINYLFTKLFGK